MDHRVDAVGRQPRVHRSGEGVDAHGQQVGEEITDDAEGQPEDGQHDAQEDGDGPVLAGQDAVDAHAADVLPALVALDYAVVAHALDEHIAHIRQGGIAVHAVLVLHLQNAVLYQL